MKSIMIVILLLGLAVIGMAGIVKTNIMLKSVSIISGIASLRQENNGADCLRLESHVNLTHRGFQDSIIPIMWLGGVICAIGIIGLVIEIVRQRNGTANKHLEHISNSADAV